MSFSDLGLAPSLAQAAHSRGLIAPTAIQQQAIPVVLAGRDLLACAPTGTGKTAAYVLPLLQAWMLSDAATRQGGARQTQALILVPTRELAAQVAELIYQLGESLGKRPKVGVLTGGVSINPQLMALRGGVDMVIATPGRLLDVVEHSRLQLKTIRTWVLDEADRLMDLGFAEELHQVMALVPAAAERQTLLLSATFPPAVQGLVATLLRPDHERIEIASTHQQDATIEQRAYLLDTNKRTALLYELVQQHPGQRMLVFVASRYSAEHVANKLYDRQINATAFHGDLSQGARQQVLQEFKNQQWQVLITTDLAARGIHVDELPLVINYDLPRSPVEYTHRIGRTGRAAKSGVAISFVTPATEAHWKLIARRNALDLELLTLPQYPVTETAPARQPHEDGNDGGVKGKRMSKKDKLRAAQAIVSKPRHREHQRQRPEQSGLCRFSFSTGAVRVFYFLDQAASASSRTSLSVTAASMSSYALASA
ncbi:DEAD/DEAH box helicase [Diaphorobacter aerolatus]|uniref:DEAD/DEAH box helicase n=1 Tax=Diaphorobacter aerolatus TaxID=1288495 RepID=A0A7H0GL66_9BURK|nr:DEAD/DEAH box helicase [Diaphorobacter aerolatus]QNP49032.1 DEAD/DEAH box helicase [Diaphorobacter aerolatus]